MIWASVLRWVVPAAGFGLLGWALVNWHAGRIEAVRLDAMQEQARLSAADFAAAAELAAAQQAAEIEAQRKAARANNRKVSDDLALANDRIGRAAAELRQLRAEARQAGADPGGAGQGGAAALPRDAGGDPGAVAPAGGWVDIDLAEAADRATAAHDAAVNWWWEQCRAWRGPKPEVCMVE
jgi:hypothetical protein